MTIATIIPLLFALIFPACLLWAAYSDLTSFTIRNRTSLILAAGFVPFALLVHLSPWGMAWHLGLGVAILVLGMVMFALNIMGGGDAKLLAAAALWLGKDAVFAFIVYTALSGGVLAVTLLVSRRTFGVYAPRFPPWIAKLLDDKAGVPYGVAICAGALCAAPLSDLFGLLKSLVFS